jgi:hypothetical protein
MFIFVYLCNTYTISGVVWSKLIPLGKELLAVALNKQNKVSFLRKTRVALNIKQ